jgi:hypothetical protein
VSLNGSALYREANPGKTPNCVRCNRLQPHTVCEVLHLVDRDWVVDRTPLVTAEDDSPRTRLDNDARRRD